MTSTQESERRQKIRVEFKTRISLKTKQSEYHINGSSKDLSVKGIFISTREKIPVGTACEIEVLLTGMTDEIKLSMQGTVARRTDDGIGVIFNSVDLDSYTHLKNIVMYNTKDPDNVF